MNHENIPQRVHRLLTVVDRIIQKAGLAIANWQEKNSCPKCLRVGNFQLAQLGSFALAVTGWVARG
ncbi:MAG: hypothetical protein AB8B63_18025, partial [Granulosicoccus sp.]